MHSEDPSRDVQQNGTRAAPRYSARTRRAFLITGVTTFSAGAVIGWLAYTLSRPGGTHEQRDDGDAELIWARQSAASPIDDLVESGGRFLMVFDTHRDDAMLLRGVERLAHATLDASTPDQLSVRRLLVQNLQGVPVPTSLAKLLEELKEAHARDLQKSRK